MPPPPQPAATWKYLVWIICLLVTVVVLMIGYSLYQMVHSKIPEAYNAWTTGTLVVGYLETHSNQWPRSWEDLRDATNFHRPTSVFVPIERLQQSVRIDWRVDIAQLLETAHTNPNATIRVVTRLDGSPLRAVWGADTEPNTAIMNYLRAAWPASTDQGGTDRVQASGSEPVGGAGVAAPRRSP